MVGGKSLRVCLVLLSYALVGEGFILRHVEATRPPPKVLSRLQVGQKTTESEVTDGACPFSRRFPRYTIDLTTVKSKKNEEGVAFEIPFVSQFSKSLARRKVEKQFGIANLTFITETTGVGSFSYLWRAVANFCDIDAQEIVIALPELLDDDIVMHWVDIVEWLQQQQICNELRHVSISFHCVDGVPVVQISKESTRNSSGNSNIATSSVSLDEKTLVERTQAWVKRLLVEEGICPFTKSVRMSGQGLADIGVPVGSIAYHSSFATVKQLCSLMADTFDAIHQMILAGPGGRNGVSSILLAAPEFDSEFPLWSGPVFAVLEASVVAAKAEADVGVVCFHPEYRTPDGSSWPGFGHMHSVPRLKQWLLEEDPECPLSDLEIAAGGAWQRRTPHATINVLRADQLEAAEGRRTTENLYPENIRKLVGENGIGIDRLESDLDKERQLGI